MSKEIISFNWAIIVEAIENSLATYPDGLYQKFLAIPELRQKLVAYIIRRARNLYTVVIEDAQNSSISPKYLYPLNNGYI